MLTMQFEIKFRGKEYYCEWFDDTNFESLKRLRHAHGFVFDKGRICMIKINEKKGWELPGGGIEKGETLEQAFIRELEEEADLEIKNIIRLGYLKITPKTNPSEFFYQARFAAEVREIKKQTIDPAEGIIPERIFVKPTDFGNYTAWRDMGVFQMKKALEALKMRG